MFHRDAREAEVTLEALLRTRKQTVLRHFMDKLDGFRLLDRLLRKFSVGKNGGTSCTLQVLRAIEALPVSVGAVSSCDIVSTLADVASTASDAISKASTTASGDAVGDSRADELQMLSQVKEGAIRSRTELEKKVKSFALLRSTTIQKKQHGAGSDLGDGSGDIGREVERLSRRSILMEGVPNGWGRRNILAHLNGLRVVAVEMAGAHKRGQCVYVELAAEDVARAAVERLSLLQVKGAPLDVSICEPERRPQAPPPQARRDSGTTTVSFSYLSSAAMIC